MTDEHHYISQLDKRLWLRESWARWLALLVFAMIFYFVQRTLPAEIDYTNPGQMLFLGQVQGGLFGFGAAACAFFFFIQASEKSNKDTQPVKVENVDPIAVRQEPAP